MGDRDVHTRRMRVRGPACSLRTLSAANVTTPSAPCIILQIAPANTTVHDHETRHQNMPPNAPPMHYRQQVEKKTVLENLDLVILAMDEIVDGG